MLYCIIEMHWVLLNLCSHFKKGKYRRQLINFMVVILAQCKCIPNHHVHLKYITIWFVNCTPIWAALVAQLVKDLPQCGRPGSDPWVGKIPWRRERLPTPVFWPGELHGLYSPWGYKESDTTERLTHSPQYSLKKKKKWFYDSFKKLWMAWFFSDNTGSIHDFKSESKNKCNAISSDTNPTLLECFIALNLLWCIMNKGHDALGCMFSPLNGRKKKGRNKLTAVKHLFWEIYCFSHFTHTILLS